MYYKTILLNRKGFTLIEVIAAISILAITMSILLPMLPQLLNWENKTKNEIVASNLLPQIVGDIKQIDSVTNFFNKEFQFCNQPSREDVSFKEYEVNNLTYNTKLNICKEADVDLFRTHITVLSSDGKKITDSYTYLPGDSDE